MKMYSPTFGTAQLIEQQRGAQKFVADLLAYAKSIGCVVIRDEVTCDTEEKSRLISAWCTEHMSHG